MQIAAHAALLDDPDLRRRMVRPFIVKPVSHDLAPRSPPPFRRRDTRRALCSPGRRRHRPRQTLPRPARRRRLTSWPRVNSTPSIKDSSDASSPFAASKAYPRTVGDVEQALREALRRKVLRGLDVPPRNSSGVLLLGDGPQQLVFRSFFSLEASSRPRPRQLVPPRRRPAPAPRLLPPYQHRPSCSARASIVAYCVVPQGRVTWRCAARRALLCALTAKTPSINSTARLQASLC